MRRRYTRGRQPQKRANQLVSVAVLVFMLSAVGSTAFLHNPSGQSGQEGEGNSVTAQAKQWISTVVNRGTGERALSATSLDAKLYGLLETTYPSLGLGEKPSGTGGAESNTTGKGGIEAEKQKKTVEKKEKAAVNSVDQNAAESAQVAEIKDPVAVVDTASSKDPVVLIYHTHATESYQPVTEGNFHSLGEEGTVRQVGIAMTKALEEKGIPVLHDMTLHDTPSYNQSYSRSIETAKNHLAKNPSIKIVIDLHRDAASYTGNKGKTINIKGETAATYSLVIGQDNANLKQLTTFANELNKTANRMYPGFGGRIIEKQYRFNQYISDHAILLEIGNNENTIQQVTATGKYFADVLEEYMKNNL